MSKSRFAKIFQNGSSQAVRLPKEFGPDGDGVRARQLGNGVLMEPLIVDVEAFFKRIDNCDAADFMANGREQPAMHEHSPL